MSKAIQPPKRSDSEAFPVWYLMAEQTDVTFLLSSSITYRQKDRRLEIYAKNPNFILNLDTLRGLKDILGCLVEDRHILKHLAEQKDIPHSTA